jgi:cbb3-type cytochrome oxidase subunit 3
MNIIEHVFAAPTGTPLGTIGGEGLGPMGNLGDTIGKTEGAKALMSITNIVSGVIGFMTVLAGIWFIFMFLIGGYTWMTSMGDKHRLEEARNRIVNALIGLVIVIAGWGVLALVGQFFGWDITISHPETIINQIKFK